MRKSINKDYYAKNIYFCRKFIKESVYRLFCFRKHNTVLNKKVRRFIRNRFNMLFGSTYYRKIKVKTMQSALRMYYKNYKND